MRADVREEVAKERKVMNRRHFKNREVLVMHWMQRKIKRTLLLWPGVTSTSSLGLPSVWKEETLPRAGLRKAGWGAPIPGEEHLLKNCFLIDV